jgi:hypothetical protein
MIQPPGFTHPSFPDHVCHLKKSLYDLKQAPRAWFSRLSSRLLELGFQGSRADTSLFIFGHGATTIFILIYVDDILVASPNSALIDRLISKLQGDFPIKDLGRINYFLGVEVIHAPHGLFFSQRKYILDLLQKTNMLTAKTVTSPCPLLPLCHDLMEKFLMTHLSIAALLVHCSTSLSQDQTSHLPSIKSTNFSNVQPFLIGPLLSEFCGT